MTGLDTYVTNRISHYAPGRSDGGAATPQAITYLRTRRETLAEAACLEQLQPVLAIPTGAKTATASPAISTSYTLPRTLRLCPSTLLRTSSGQAWLTAA